MLPANVIELHKSKPIMYGVSKGTQKAEEELKIKEIVEGMNVEIIEYEKLGMIRDWAVILGKGL